MSRASSMIIALGAMSVILAGQAYAGQGGNHGGYRTGTFQGGAFRGSGFPGANSGAVIRPDEAAWLVENARRADCLQGFEPCTIDRSYGQR
jgi:hypothetical protein